MGQLFGLVIFASGRAWGIQSGQEEEFRTAITRVPAMDHFLSPRRSFKARLSCGGRGFGGGQTRGYYDNLPRAVLPFFECLSRACVPEGCVLLTSFWLLFPFLVVRFLFLSCFFLVFFPFPFTFFPLFITLFLVVQVLFIYSFICLLFSSFNFLLFVLVYFFRLSLSSLSL